MDLAVIMAFSILTLAFSLLYFFIYYRNQERFMLYWGFSWISFTLSLISLMFWILCDLGSDDRFRLDFPAHMAYHADTS